MSQCLSGVWNRLEELVVVGSDIDDNDNDQKEFLIFDLAIFPLLLYSVWGFENFGQTILVDLLASGRTLGTDFTLDLIFSKEGKAVLPTNIYTIGFSKVLTTATVVLFTTVAVVTSRIFDCF